MMKERSGKRSISGLSALILLGVFAVGILSVLLGGAHAYKRLTQRDAVSYDSRTCVQYLATKVRQAPAPDAVVLSRFGEGDCLRICEQVAGCEYWTQVYCHDGWMMELFTAADAGLLPEDGEKILPLRGLEMERSGDLLRLEIVDGNGTENTILLNLRGGKGAAP